MAKRSIKTEIKAQDAARWVAFGDWVRQNRLRQSQPMTQADLGNYILD